MTQSQGSGWQTGPKPQAGPAWGQPVKAAGYETRVYKGNLATATMAFQADAANMAQHGWFPVSQNYQPGSWGAGAFLLALLLCLLLVGILVFIYMILVKPAGQLVVMYKHKDTP